MKICRVYAEWDSDPLVQFVVICGVNDDGLIVKDQEWYGCAKEADGTLYPFYVESRLGLLCYGRPDVDPENTDLFRDVIVEVGRSFKLQCKDESDGMYERKYRITRVKVLSPTMAV
jgi:hypothetical protein